MTVHERIDAAIAARARATPGPWEALLSKGMVYGHTSGSPVSVSGISWPAEPAEANTILIAAAPDLVDEVVRLRAWQHEAVRWLEGGRTIMDVVGAPKDMKNALIRLIAEA